MTDDLFNDLFTLEDAFHTEGYEAGYADGLQQAQLEARVFGLEQGYAKFIEMGLLQAKAQLWWAATVSPSDGYSKDASERPAIQSSSRVVKHLSVLLALVDTRTLSYDNNDDDVAAFDDRLKRANAKVKVIERLLREDDATSDGTHGASSTGPVTAAAAGRAMEDFGT